MSKLICDNCNSSDFVESSTEGFLQCEFCGCLIKMNQYDDLDEKTLSIIETIKEYRVNANYDKALNMLEQLLNVNHEHYNLYYEALLSKYRVSFIKAYNETILICDNIDDNDLIHSKVKDDIYYKNTIKYLESAKLPDSQKAILKDKIEKVTNDIQTYLDSYNRVRTLIHNGKDEYDTYMILDSNNNDINKEIFKYFTLHGLRTYVEQDIVDYITLINQLVRIDQANQLVITTVDGKPKNDNNLTIISRFLKTKKNSVYVLTDNIEIFSDKIKNITKNIFTSSEEDMIALKNVISKNQRKEFNSNHYLTVEEFEFVANNIDTLDFKSNFASYIIYQAYKNGMEFLVDSVLSVNKDFRVDKKLNKSDLYSCIINASKLFNIKDEILLDFYNEFLIKHLTKCAAETTVEYEKISLIEKIAEAGNYDAYLEIGLYYLNNGKNEKSSKYFRLAASNGIIEANIPLGNYYLQNGEVSKAIDCFTICIDNNIPNGYFNLGVLYYNLRKEKPNYLQKSIEYFEELVDNEEYQGESCYKLAKIYKKLEDSDKSKYYLDLSEKYGYKK